MAKILILYYSRNGGTKALAEQIALGVESIPHATAILRTVQPVSPTTEASEPAIPANGDLYVTKEDLADCDGLILGSPTRFGNMAAPLKYFLDTTGDEWFKGTLIGKPAAVFTSTSTSHTGHESTLLTMMIPLLHHGMLMVGIPASEAAVLQTVTGGSTYGAGHIAGTQSNKPLSDDEIQLARALGKRVAEIAIKLA